MNLDYLKGYLRAHFNRADPIKDAIAVAYSEIAACTPVRRFPTTSSATTNTALKNAEVYTYRDLRGYEQHRTVKSLVGTFSWSMAELGASLAMALPLCTRRGTALKTHAAARLDRLLADEMGLPTMRTEQDAAVAAEFDIVVPVLDALYPPIFERQGGEIRLVTTMVTRYFGAVQYRDGKAH